MPKPRQKTLNVVPGIQPGSLVATWNFSAKSISRDGQDIYQVGSTNSGWTGQLPTSPTTLTYLQPGTLYKITVVPTDGTMPKTYLASTAQQPTPIPIPVPAPVPAPVPVPTPPPPVVNTWLDQVGICTHFSYYDTDYVNRTWIKGLLGDLGIKHIRDGFGTDQVLIDYFNELHTSLGIVFTLTMDPSQGSNLADRLNAYRQLALTGALGTIEGQNEWDVTRYSVNGWTITDSNWANQYRLWTSAWVQAVKADHAFDNVKLAAGALAQTMNTSPYNQVGTIAGLDYGTTHDYPGDQHQMTDAIAQGAQANARIIAGVGKPVISTETGFTVGAGGPYTPVTEQQQADLTMQLIKAHSLNGIHRTFIYELLSWGNSDFERGLSLVRGDKTLRPVYGAVKTLLAA